MQLVSWGWWRLIESQKKLSIPSSSWCGAVKFHFWLLNVQFLMCQTLGFAAPKRKKHNTCGMDSVFPIGKAQNH